MMVEKDKYYISRNSNYEEGDLVVLSKNDYTEFDYSPTRLVRCIRVIDNRVIFVANETIVKELSREVNPEYFL